MNLILNGDALKVLDEIISRYIPVGEPFKALMSDRERALIKSRFCAVNREINERYLAGQLSQDWFLEGTAHKANAGLQNLYRVDLASVLRETVIRMADAHSDYEIGAMKRMKIKKLLRKVRQRFLQSACNHTAYE